MLVSLSLVFVILLGIACLVTLIVNFRNKDKSIIWSPITFLTLTILYYYVLPEFLTSRQFEGYDVSQYSIPFHVGALLSYASILFGYYFLSPDTRTPLRRWNVLFSPEKTKQMAIFLFLVALALYVPFRGFRLSIFVSEDSLREFDYDNAGYSFYFVNAIAILCSACCLVLFSWRSHIVTTVIILWITMVTFIISGFRYRIVILIISLLTVYHLYHGVKKARIIPIILIASVMYLGFNIMDRTRSYGNGINLGAIESSSTSELTTRAIETERVYNYSIMVMNAYYESGEREYFTPLITAITIPLPRKLFPWKPNAEYLRNATRTAIRNGGEGSAYVNFVEAFLSFGWFGIILSGLFLGWLSRRFWNNYKTNSKSIGAILALAIYNGLTYVFISRGYLAQEFSCFLFFLCVPFWLTGLLSLLKVNR